MTYEGITYCDQVAPNKWLVFCIDCDCEIGTMTADILLLAIAFGRSRGGVKCPHCRERSCYVCGVRNPDGWHTSVLVRDRAQPICTVCELSVSFEVEDREVLNVLPAEILSSNTKHLK